MTWMNEYEINELQCRLDPEECPKLVEAAKALSRLVDWTNGRSDGWAYWRKPSQASIRLQERLQLAEDARRRNGAVDDLTKDEWSRLFRPIRQFLSDQKVDDPDMLLFPPPPPPPSPGRRTVTAVVRVTIEPTAPVEYSGDDLADEIRDRVFRAVTEGVPYDVIVMTVEGSA